MKLIVIHSANLASLFLSLFLACKKGKVDFRGNPITWTCRLFLLLLVPNLAVFCAWNILAWIEPKNWKVLHWP